MDQNTHDSLANSSKETRPERKHLTDLDQIVHRHLNDENDKITEDDIRDAVIGFPARESAVSIELPADSSQFLQEGASDQAKAG